jgi:ribosomal protein S18 acetylase RimI-like enzyme
MAGALPEVSAMPATTVNIRPAEAADREGVQRLWEASGLARATPDEWDSLMAGETSAVLVAEDQGEVAAAGIATFDGWRAYIYHVAVGDKHRRLGLAHRLIGEAEQYLLGAGARHVYVMVGESNTEGLALVGSLGYVPEDEMVFVKRLATRVS